SAFVVQAEAKNFDRALALLAAVQLHPAFPASALDVIKNAYAQQLTGAQSRPDWTAQLAMESALYPRTDPVREHPTPASVRSITLDDVKAWYARAYRPDLTTIAVVGNLSPHYVRSEIAKYFGAWRAHGPKPDFHYPRIAMNGPKSVNVPSADAKQSTVKLTELLAVHQDDPRFIALELANTILTGEGTGSELFDDLRKNTGYVYSVGSTLDIGKVRSTYQFTFAADPKNADIAAARLLADVRHLQTDLVSDDELTRAKETVLARSVLPLASYGSIAAQLLASASGTRTLETQAYAKTGGAWDTLLSITPRQIRDAMARWVRVQDFVRVTITPQGSAGT
ncbi:MAG TPA: insulinase family protein, partial [Candidatus Baltobacteraceae bacterium]